MIAVSPQLKVRKSYGEAVGFYIYSGVMLAKLMVRCGSVPEVIGKGKLEGKLGTDQHSGRISD